MADTNSTTNKSNARPGVVAEFDIRVTQMQEDELDQQPFGVIRLDRKGTVVAFNKYEQQLARMRKQDVVGKNFFVDVAPCTRVQEFYGRFLEGVERRELNATFGYVFNFKHGARNVDISLFYKKADDSIWVLVRGG